MTHKERVQAVIDFGFTERQARFLVLVLRHAGVCVPRQYASFSGIANGGRRCNAFFDRLVRRGYANENGCVHNRARLYHLHNKPLYHVIGEVTSRYRRRVSPRLAVERLMLLDAVLTMPNLEWLTTAAEKAASWTVRLVFPRPLDRVYDAYQTVIREELESPLHPATIGELKWYFAHRQQAGEGPVHPQTQGFLNVGAKVFGTPRFTEMYRRWLKHGNAVFEGPSSPVTAEALTDGRGRVESVVLPPSYPHLSPLVNETLAPPS